MELQVNERESLLIVTALGMCQNRVGQHASWDQRKRLATLRGRLADCVTIGDDEEAKAVRKAITKTKRRIERNINLGLEISALRERLKADAGITDEKANPNDDE
jgi:protein-arginine kinase activator protein McsA